MTQVLTTLSKPLGDKKCLCVRFHNPRPIGLEAHHVWPLYLGGPDVRTNMLWICPTTHTNVHRIMETFVKAGVVLKRVKGQQPYAHRIAVQGFNDYVNSRLPS